MDIAIVLIIVLIAVAMFSFERLPLEVSALTVVCLLALTRILTPAEAFAGFSNDTVIFIFALLAMTQGLVATGAIQQFARVFSAMGRFGARGYLFGVMLLVATVSAFMSNTVTTAAFVPPALHGARSAGVKRSWLLMPVAFASMLGGMGFLYGTSTNLVVSAEMRTLGLGALGIAELSPVGIPTALLGIVLLTLLAPRILRVRSGATASSGKEFLADARVGAALVGRTVDWVARFAGVAIQSVERDLARLAPDPNLALLEGDRLVLRGARREILRARHVTGLLLGDGQVPRTAMLAEAILPPYTQLNGSLATAAARLARDRIAIVAHHPHHRSPWHTEAATFAKSALRPGDGLLIAGSREQLKALAADSSLIVLPQLEPIGIPRRGHSYLSVGIFVTALVLGSVGAVPLAVAGLTGVLAMVATGCLDTRQVLRIDWRVVLLIGSMLALGAAMEKTGAGDVLGELIAKTVGAGGPRVVMLGLMVLTALLSIPMSNQAAALVVLPVAVSAAQALQINPRAFAVAVAFSASCSFMTPLEPSAMLVYGPGRYRFSDFLRLGSVLTVATLAMLVWLIPLVWRF